jgi:hypothetical protein
LARAFGTRAHADRGYIHSEFANIVCDNGGSGGRFGRLVLNDLKAADARSFLVTMDAGVVLTGRARLLAIFLGPTSFAVCLIQRSLIIEYRKSCLDRRFTTSLPELALSL